MFARGPHRRWWKSTGSLGGQPIGVAFAVPLDQAMRLHFAQILAELVQAVARSGESEGGEAGVVDLLGRPPAGRCAARRISMSRIMRVSWILMPGNFADPTVMGNASRCKSGNST